MFRLKPPCPKENWARLARVDGLSMDRRWKMLSVAGSQTVVPDADAWWCLDIVLNKTIGKEVCRCTICTHLIYYIYNIHMHLHIHLYIHITYPTNQSYEILHIIYSLYTAVRSIERERFSAPWHEPIFCHSSIWKLSWYSGCVVPWLWFLVACCMWYMLTTIGKTDVVV